jgi:hypothetical protein
MSVKDTDLIQWALATSRRDEAGVRASISRAYYAAYHRCLAWEARLPVKGNPSGPNGAVVGKHQELINRLRQPDAAQCSPAQQVLSKQLGMMLQQLKAQRFRADYELSASLGNTDASAACSDARTMLVRAV